MNLREKLEEKMKNQEAASKVVLARHIADRLTEALNNVKVFDIKTSGAVKSVEIYFRIDYAFVPAILANSLQDMVKKEFSDAGWKNPKVTIKQRDMDISDYGDPDYNVTVQLCLN